MAKKDRLARRAQAERKAQAPQDDAAAQKYFLDKAIDKETAYQAKNNEPSSRVVPPTTTTEEIVTPDETVVAEQVDGTGRMSKRKQRKATEAQNNASAQKYFLDKIIPEQKNLYDKAVEKETAYQKIFGAPSSRVDERAVIDENNPSPITEGSGPTILGSEANAPLDIKSTINNIADADAKIEADAAIAKMGAGGDSQIVKSINQTEEQLKAANSSVPDETMKESLGLNSPISPAIAKAVEKSETTGAPIEVTTEDIRKVNEAIDSEDYYSMSPEEQRQLEAYSKLLNDSKTKVRKSEPALEKLGVQDYYPDMNQGIQEGSYSGSIVGSIPIYTAKGGVLPIGVFDARKRAVEAEAVKAKKTKEDLIELAKVKTAPQYQQAADNLAFGILDKYLNMANGDASVLMDPTNPIGMRVQKELNKVNNIKQEADWLEKRGQELLKAINDEKMYVPNESKEVLKQWLGGNYSMEELMNNKKALKDFHNIYNTLKINDNETYVIGQHFLKWKQDIAPIVADFNASIEALPADKYNELVAIKARGNNDMFMQAAMKYMPESRLSKLANGLYSTGEFTMSRQAFDTYLGSWFNNEIITKLDIRDSGRLQERKFQYQKEKDQQDRIFENLKINVNNIDNKNAILDAANSNDEGFLLSTIRKITGQGDAMINNSNVIVQKLDSKGLEGKNGQTTFKNSDKFKIGGKWQSTKDVKNKYSNYDKYVIKTTDDNGDVVITLNTNRMSLDNIPVPGKEEQALIKYGYATGWSDNMQFDTKFDKATTYQAYPDKNGKLIPMTVDDYKDPAKVGAARPMATVFESTGKIIDGIFVPMGTTTKVIDLSNDVDRAAMDNYFRGENTQYNTFGDMTRGGTVTDEDEIGGGGGDAAAATPIFDFSAEQVE